MQETLAEIWRGIIIGEGKGWVIFSHGTCVIFTDPAGDLTDRALAVMREWGPVHAGSPAGDFSVIELESHPGWVVTCHHPDVLTYVAPDEVNADPSEVEVGLFGRGKRETDASDLIVVHVEQAQPSG